MYKSQKNTVGFKGSQLDLLIKQGSSFSFTVNLSDESRNPLNLTGTTFSANIKKAYTDLTPIVSLAFTIINPLIGQVRFSLTPVQTTLLLAGYDEKDTKSQYLWDCEKTDSLGEVVPLFFGDVQVFRNI